tara:strand:+ start:242 stop:976 length:735 start_codon:yes stop_codon:yes gene_type:complete
VYNQKKIKFRTKVKHLYFKTKRNILNQRLNLKTIKKYLELKNSSSINEETLESYYIYNNIQIIEGNSTQSSEQKEYLKKYKVQFKNILEIGFNAGHSSELFLDTNPNSVVTSIDLGYWYYCKFGIRYLEKKFPNRFQIILKDSIKALRDYKTISEGTIFDFIYIDGNHSYEYAYNDILNCKKFSHDLTIIAVDDVVDDDNFRTNSNLGPTKAWKTLVSNGKLIELDCSHFKDINRGMAVGKFIF